MPIRYLPHRLKILFLLLPLSLLAGATAAEPEITRFRLENGLTLVIAEDHASPTFGLSVVYGVGFRLEPKGRTGFAHLFEHMMFEGTPSAPKGTFDRVVEGGGGVLNGSTRYDYTNYISTAPVSALEPVLWLEADRMRHLDFSEENLQNQKDVVKEEIRVNVKNRPYGLFFWTDLAALAFDWWENAHDGYGSFEDLDKTTVEEVKQFHDTYYVPNNAVIAVVGDVNPEQVRTWVEKYFGTIPPGEVPPRPDVSEAPNTAERFLRQADAHATVPALAVGWKMPPPDSPDYFPLAVTASLLLDGEASLLHQELVKQEQTLLEISGGLNWPLGDALTNGGPSLLVAFGLYKPGKPARYSVGVMQRVIDELARKGPDPRRLEAVKTKMKADFYKAIARSIRRADYLAVTQLLWGDAAMVERYGELIDAVTDDDVKRVAARYLTPENRSWIDRQVAKGGKGS